MKITEKTINQIRDWIKNETERAHANGVCIAISGGIDSAVCAGLAKLAFPNNTDGIFFDIDSSPQSLDNFKSIVKSLNINHKIINLKNSFNSILKDLNFIKENDLVAQGNIKSRLRMNALYAYANIKNYLVIGTSNYSEIYLGYFTKWGDGAADIYPIAKFKKSEIYQLASFFNLDQKVIIQKPTADLWCGQTDEKELGFKYSDLERYFANDANLDQKIIKKINTCHKNSEHKRSANLNSFNF
ncbi:/ nadE / putative NH(3)-dependent NAD(+) synthetase /:337939 Reverse [Candidatus Hepatoplasma crinochetorum]|uniref:NH(3)-dependent NAD(+) synthetase n=1 Tax=Candidatus Hepatoplasma crinochetorum TaxID=295596 RepID=A0A0G7ZN05_9MOLU|nr:/ nadE / putative NH(3)-dependent NAD(+) synthetase /:337939 Reverse [Candidatus Hepatoplasma crinochetorum]